MRAAPVASPERPTWATAPTQSISAGGVAFAYRELGKHHGGTPLILLIHLAAVLDKLDAPAPEQSVGRPVLMGGPVERERGFVLHTDDYLSETATLPVANGVSMTATREVLQAIGGDSGPRRSILALGYAGWGPGQLEQELRDNVWLTCEADEDLLFDPNPNDKWSKALAKIGVHASSLSGQTGRA